MTNLSQAHLTGAKYNTFTCWPDGFDPAAAGAILIENEPPEDLRNE